MKSKKTIKLGGFCGVNTGSISNSFSVSDMSKAREIASFCYKNTGEINTCFAKSSIRKQDVNNFCLELPKYKRPRKIIFASVPRNPTGKIEKPKLREMYRDIDPFAVMKAE